MKKMIIFFSLCLLTINLFGQKIKFDGNKVSADGVDVFLLEESDFRPLLKRFMIKSADASQEWIEMVPEDIIVNDTTKVFYKLTFIGTDKEAYVEASLGFKKFITKQLLKYNAVSANGLDIAGVERFIANMAFKSPTALSRTQTNNNNINAAQYTIVERNRSKNISVMTGKIEQDFKTIATYQEGSRTEGGKMYVILTILDINGKQILQAEFPKFNAERAGYYISGDDRPHSVTLQSGTTDMQIKDLVKTLIAKGVF